MFKYYIFKRVKCLIKYIIIYIINKYIINNYTLFKRVKYIIKYIIIYKINKCN